MIKTLTGSNAFLLRAELHKIIEQFVAEHGEFGLEKLSAEDTPFDKIKESIQAMPFLASKKLVVLSDPAANKDVAEKVDDLLAAVNDQTDLILVEPKFDKRSSLYKTLKKQTELTEYNELDEHALAQWLSSQAKEQHGELKLADASYLVQRVGVDQLRLSHELEKLVLYDPAVTRQTIDLLTEQTPQSSVFNLLDAAFAGNTKKALQLYQEQRRQKVEPQAMLAMVAWQLHTLALVKTAGERSIDTIAKEAKLNPFVVRKSSDIARRITLPELKKLIADTLQLDIRLKTESMDADEALQTLLLTITSSQN